MKRYGKVITGALLASIICAVGLMIYVDRAKAADYTKTYVIPYNGESYKTIVLRCLNNGNCVNATTGTSSAATTWDSAELAGVRNTLSGDWVFTMPTLSSTLGTVYFTGYNVAPASITKDTIYDKGPLLWDPRSGAGYTDASPTEQGELRVRTFQE